MHLLTVQNVLPLALILTTFAVGVLTHPEIPGIYMDSVNPDYMVVPLVNPASLPVPVWIQPGNYLWNKIPVLVQLYHGALTVFVGLPGYALFGTDALGVRLTHGSFGALILASSWVALVSIGVSRRVAVLFLVALALDPGYVFTFRTQAYITMLPTFLVLLAVAALSGASRQTSATSARVFLFISGFCAGLSVYGYFFYLFYGLAIAALAGWSARERDDLRTGLLIWVTGAFVGVAPMLLGFVLIAFDQGGIAEALRYAASNAEHVQVVNTKLGLSEKLSASHAAAMAMLDHSYHTSLMLGRALPSYGSRFTLIILFWVPAVLFGYQLARRSADRGAAATALLLFGPVIPLAAIFGGRVTSHHFAPVLPLAYCWAAATYSCALRTLQGTRIRHRVLRPVASAGLFVVVGVLGWLNTANLQIIVSELKLTGGVGWFSDAITRFGEEAHVDRGTADYVLPDWGLFFPFVMLTRGEVGVATAFSVQSARHALCSGRSIVVAVTAQATAAPATAVSRVSAWTDELGWTPPSLRTYADRTGRTVVTSARWDSKERANAAQPC
jgi:hypothetical protein